MIIHSTLQSRPSLENGGITGPVFTIEHLAPFVTVVHGHGCEGLKEENVHNRNEELGKEP